MQNTKQNFPSKSRKRSRIHKWTVDWETGDRVCTRCGLVAEGHVTSPNSDINSFSQSKNKIGRPYPKQSSISDASLRLKRALKLERKRPWAERRINRAVTEIHRLGSKYELGEAVIMQAVALLKKALKLKIFKTKFLDLIATVSLFYVLERGEYSISIKQLIKGKGFGISLALRYYYDLMQELKLMSPKKTPQKYVRAMASDLNINSGICDEIMGVVGLYMRGFNTSGFNPKGICAGAIYYVCLCKNIPISQSLIAKVAKNSEITIRNRYREIKKVMARNY